MTMPAGRKFEVTISSLATLAKRKASSDFTLQVSPGFDLPMDVPSLADAGLQEHIYSGNTYTVSAVRAGGAWWLFRAVSERGVDSSGRPLYHMVMGRIEDCGESDLAWLVLTSLQGSTPDLAMQGTVTIPVTAEDANLNREGERIVLALALGESLSVGEEPNQVAAALLLLGPGLVGCVSLSSPALPKRLLRTPTVFISRASLPPQPLISQFLEEFEGRLPPYPGDLARLNTTPQRRLQLAELALAEPRRFPPGSVGLSQEEEHWLLRTSFRPELLAKASAAQIHSWLGDGTLQMNDLPQVASRLADADALLVAVLLESSPDGLSEFLAIYPGGAAGVDRLLPPTARDLWRCLQAGCPDQGFAALSSAEMQILDQAGLLDRLPLADLSSCLSRFPSTALLVAWTRSSQREGMPAEVASALRGGVQPKTAPVVSPRPEPGEDWLCAVSWPALRAAGRWATGNAEWRRWWRLAIQRHPEAGALARFGLDGPWCDELSWWMSAEVADGTLGREPALKALARFRHRDLVPDTDLLPVMRLLTPQGADVIEFVWSGKSWKGQDALSAAQVKASAEITEAGLLTQNEIVEAIQRGLPVDILSALPVSTAVVALLNQDLTPPVRPPHDWIPELAPVLARQMMHRGFWRRWTGGLGPEMLDWISQQTASYANAELPSTMHRVERGEAICLTPAHIALVGPALSRLAALRQVLLWSTGPVAEREAVLRSLCALPGLTDLGPWLTGQLLTWESQIAAPELTVPEQLIVWPMLQYSRTCARRTMDQPIVADAEESLLRLILRSLATEPASPLPPPSPEARRTRPQWVAALGALPGWEHWCQQASTASEELS